MRATEEKLKQMADKVETTDKEREKHIKKDMEEMKKRYDTRNGKTVESRDQDRRNEQADVKVLVPCSQNWMHS